jgi:hypothetical protein
LRKTSQYPWKLSQGAPGLRVRPVLRPNMYKGINVTTGDMCFELIFSQHLKQTLCKLPRRKHQIISLKNIKIFQIFTKQLLSRNS